MRNPLEDERVQLGAIAFASVSIVAFLTSLASQTLPEPEKPVVAPPLSKNAEAPPSPMKPELAPPPAESPSNPVAEGPPVEGAAEEPPKSAQEPPSQQPPPPSSSAASDDGEAVAAIRPSLPLEPPVQSSPETAIETHTAQQSIDATAPQVAEKRVPKKRKAVSFKPVRMRKAWVGPLPNHKSDAEEPAPERSGLQLLY